MVYTDIFSSSHWRRKTGCPRSTSLMKAEQNDVRSSASSCPNPEQQEKDIKLKTPSCDKQGSNIRHPLFTDTSGLMRQSTFIQAPYDYVQALPSKGVREQLIQCFNHWLRLSPAACANIGDVITRLHNSSLLLDDIQDSSTLRRGKPAAHILYGVAQTINAAHYNIIQAIQQIHQLAGVQDALNCIDLLQKLYEGQSLDVHWTYNSICPSMESYLHMIDCKTGALFELLAYLMYCVADIPMSNECARFSRLMGRYFQIRDDYQNLSSADYEQQKGFCEDLDEGKYSLPIIHLITTGGAVASTNASYLISSRRTAGGLNREQKQLMLDWLQASNSLRFTKDVLDELHSELGIALKALGETFGSDNTELVALWGMLKVN